VSTAAEPARILGSRFRRLRLLKQGMGIETWLAADQATGAEVVLKTALPDAQARNLLEAQIPQTVPAPANLHVSFEGDLWYVVRPFVPGVTLAERLRRGPLSARETVTVGMSILSALAEAHARGIWHRDVKPANIIVDEGALLSATLIDFGFARCDAAGTVRYMAPEQAGLIARPADERADLYAVGATLYECLTGEPAFSGEEVSEVLRAHLSVPPPEASRFGPGVPRALGEVVRRLLQKDPEQRYQSARAALTDLEAIAQALDAGVAEPSIAVGIADVRRTLTEPAFIGREEVLSALDTEIGRARRGEGRVLLLEGESGSGKTRLLDELGARARGAGILVLRGQGVDQEAQRPFQLLRGVIQGLLAGARASLPFGAAIRERLGEQRDAACAALPELAEVLGPPETLSYGAEEHAALRTHRAIAALLHASGTSERPCLVLLDDCQWGSEQTVEALCEWQRDEEQTSRPRWSSVVVAFRSEEVAADHPLRAIPGSGRRTIAPLSDDEIRLLAASMGGALPPEALEAVAHASQGSPFLAAAALRGMEECGALVREPEGWRVDAAALADVPVSSRAAALLSRRIDRLAPAVLRVLSVAAVLGRELDLVHLRALAGDAPEAVDDALEEARRRQIVRVEPATGRAAFLHDKLREAVLARLPGDVRRSLHRTAALRLQSAAGDAVFDLAYHFDGAGEPARALPHALAAAERARAQHAAATAERYYQIAERSAPATDPQSRIRALEGLADMLVLRGGYGDAEPRFEEAYSLATSPVAQARIMGKLAEVSFQRAEIVPSRERLERAIRLLGGRVPAGRARFAAALAVQIGVQIGHSLWARLRRRPRKIPDADRLLIHLHTRLALAYMMLRGPVPFLWASLRALNLAERREPSVEVGRAYGLHAWILACGLPRWRRSLLYADKALATSDAVGDLWLRGHAISCKSFALYSRSRFAEAVEAGEKAAAIMWRIGDKFELDSALFFQSEALYRLGELRRAIEQARRSYSRQLDCGGVGASASFHTWAVAARGRVPEGVRETERRRSQDSPMMVQSTWIAEAVCLLAEGRTGEAVEAAERADRAVREAGLRMDFPAAIPVWLAGTLRAHAERTPAWDPARSALLRRADAALRRGLRLARSFRNNRPHALREAALLAAIRGRPRRARHLLEKSRAEAESMSSRLERAQTLQAFGELGSAFGWPGATSALREARAELSGMGVQPGPASDPITPSLADRFTRLLEEGRRIARAASSAEALGVLREAASALLRPERCIVLGVGPGGEIDPGPEEAVSRTLAARAVESGEVAVVAEGVAGHPTDSVLLSGARSVLCAPVVAGGQVAALLYVTHASLGGLFGEEEQRVARFLAALAGAALENAAAALALRQQERDVRRLSEALLKSQEEERRHLALALHDGAGQLVTALRLRLDDLAVETRDAAESEKLGAAARLTEELMKELRGLAHGLRPAALDRVGLAAALGDLAESCQGAGLDIAVRIEPCDPPSPEIAENLFRIAQAALANVVQHARARCARVSLSRAAGALCLEIEDDGAGFEPATPGPKAGIGLVGMRERALGLGGTMEIAASPGRGTKITVRVPLSEGAP
jgi:signal transduction histidine kinase/tetratricopeptide (TPR) repeat protein